MSRRMEQYTQRTLAQEWRQHCDTLGANRRPRSNGTSTYRSNTNARGATTTR